MRDPYVIGEPGEACECCEIVEAGDSVLLLRLE